MFTKHFIVEGCDWDGNPVERDGKIISCNHKHRSASGASACVASMRKARHDGCSIYKVAEISSSPFLTTNMRSEVKRYIEEAA